MATASGPQMVIDGLITVLDPNNRRSTIETLTSSFLDTNSWADGQSGSVSYYSQNGATEENARVNATDPWGDTSAVWETRTTGGNNDDGGWNTSWFGIDNTKLYRFSVWMRRTSSTTSGTFYFGLYGTGGTWGVKTYDGNVNGNPYWQCVNTGAYTQNQWYLHVGHCYPAGTTITGWNADSGIYLPNNPVKYSNMGGCNVGYDVAWLSDASATMHRTYHYYSTDSTTRLQFAYPRIDVCDGTQPTVAELVSARSKRIKNVINPNQYNMTIAPKGGANINTSTVSGLVARIFNMDGTSGMYAAMSDLNLASGTYTVIAAARYKGSTRGRIVTTDPYATNNWLLGNWAGATENYYAEGWVSSEGVGAGDTNWRILACSGNTSTDSWKMYVNGTLTYSNSNGSQGPNQLTWNGLSTEPTNGEVGVMYVYNRVLTDTEVMQCYQALRARYGL